MFLKFLIEFDTLKQCISKKKLSLIPGNKLPVFVVLFKWMITNAETKKKFNLRNPNTNDPKCKLSWISFIIAF